MNRTLSLIAGTYLLLFVTTALAAEEKSGLSFLNFSKSTSTEQTTLCKTRSHKRTSQPSTWNKIVNGAQAGWTKTKQTLMPWTKASNTNKRPATQRLGNRSATPQKRSPLTGWLTGDKKQARRSQSINDFLSQP